MVGQCGRRSIYIKSTSCQGFDVSLICIFDLFFDVSLMSFQHQLPTGKSSLLRLSLGLMVRLNIM